MISVNGVGSVSGVAGNLVNTNGVDTCRVVVNNTIVYDRPTCVNIVNANVSKGILMASGSSMYLNIARVCDKCLLYSAQGPGHEWLFCNDKDCVTKLDGCLFNCGTADTSEMISLAYPYGCFEATQGPEEYLFTAGWQADHLICNAHVCFSFDKHNITCDSIITPFICWCAQAVTILDGRICNNISSVYGPYVSYCQAAWNATNSRIDLRCFGCCQVGILLHCPINCGLCYYYCSAEGGGLDTMYYYHRSNCSSLGFVVYAKVGIKVDTTNKNGGVICTNCIYTDYLLNNCTTSCCYQGV